MASKDEITARRERLSPEQLRQLEARLSAKPSSAPTIPPRGDTEAPLSYCQQGIRFLLQVFGDHDPFWNQFSCFRLRGPLDVAALERALAEVEARHEALRTTVGDGWPGTQVVHPPGPFELEVVDVAGPNAEQEVLALVAKARLEVFDVNTGPVWGCHLYRLGDDDHVLLVVADHLISDPWSLDVIAREMGTLYGAFAQGRPSPLPPVAVQYADYAVWERDWLTGDEIERQRGYWTDQFAGLEPLQLPTERPEEREWTTTGFRESIVIDAELGERVRAVSRARNATPAMAFLAAFDALLALESGNDEVVLATFNLNRTRAEVEGVVGLFANMLVLRTDCSGDPTFATLIERARDTLLGALAHSDLPVDQLISIPGAIDAINRDRQDWIVYQYFNLESASTLHMPGISASTFELEGKDPEEEIGTGPIDLHLGMSEKDGTFVGALEYNAEIFDRARVLGLVDRFRALLAAGTADPDRPLSTLL
jgi:hypothetical protein